MEVFAEDVEDKFLIGGREVGAGGKAKAGFKQGFTYTISIEGGLGIYGLFVHWLPKRPAFNVLLLQCHSNGFVGNPIA